MPSKPLIDLDAIDLSQIVVGREELDRYLQQRGRFSMVDGILHEDLEQGLVIGYKEIRSDDWWAGDHIPGRPMFPGALQIEAVAQVAAYDYASHRLGTGPGEKFVGFGGVKNVRFRGIVAPDCRLIMVVTLVRASQRMFRYQTQAFVDDRLVLDGEILGVLI